MERQYGSKDKRTTVFSSKLKKVYPQNPENPKQTVISKDMPARIVKIIVRGPERPRRIVQYLLNSKTAITFEQLLGDISTKVKANWGSVRTVYTLNGVKVSTLQEFFGDSRVFFAGSLNKIDKQEFILTPNESKILKVAVPTATFVELPSVLKVIEPLKTETVVDKMNIESEDEWKMKSYRGSPNSGRNKASMLLRYAISPPSLSEPSWMLNDYEVKETLENGSFSNTKLCRHKVSNVKYSMKVATKDKWQMNDREVNILKKLIHPNIVRIFDEVHVEYTVYMILEFAQEAGTLRQALHNEIKFCEAESICIVMDVSSALAYIHSLNIIHRSVSPEQLMICVEENGKQRVKLAGFSHAVESKEILKVICGNSVSYISPEMLGGHGYGSAVDIWAMGVILYEILYGEHPIRKVGMLADEVCELTKQGTFKFPPGKWEDISEEANKLIHGMLQLNHKSRPTAKDVLLDKWLCNVAAISGNGTRNRFYRKDEFKFGLFSDLGYNLSPIEIVTSNTQK